MRRSRTSWPGGASRAAPAAARYIAAPARRQPAPARRARAGSASSSGGWPRRTDHAACPRAARPWRPASERVGRPAGWPRDRKRGFDLGENMRRREQHAPCPRRRACSSWPSSSSRMFLGRACWWARSEQQQRRLGQQHLQQGELALHAGGERSAIGPLQVDVELVGQGIDAAAGDLLPQASSEEIDELPACHILVEGAARRAGS